MNLITQSACKFPAPIPDRQFADRTNLRLHPAIKRKIVLRICFSLLFLVTAFLQMAFAQGQITGKVTDEKGAPLAGASVTIKGTTTGATTNAEGIFTINAASNDVLVISYVGYSPQEVQVSGRTTINQALTPAGETMTDVVVVGYGSQKKTTMVGSVSAVVIDQKITTRALPNISSGLSGLSPGLQVIQNSGMAGKNGASLIIRGMGTVNNANPLIVVDGMPDVDINRININDIESISVLKDATSASVYGSRAANGVILITMKSGKGAKKTALTFNSNSGFTEPTKGFEFMADYPRALTLHQRRAAVNTLPVNQTFKNGTIDQWLAMGMIDPVRFPNTDWWDIIMRTGTYQNHNMSASGGNELSNFYASLGFIEEEGLQINNDFRQYNARFSFDYKLKSNMNTGFKFSGNWSKSLFALEEGFTDPSASNTAGNDMQYAIAGILPYDPVTGYFGGVMAYGEDPQAYNPYTVYQNMLNRVNRQEANGVVYYDWTPIKGLTARVDFSMNYYNAFQWNANMPNQAYNFQTGAFGSRVYVAPNAGIANFTYTGYKTLLNGRLNYNRRIGNNHDLAGLFVYSEEYWSDRYQASSRNDRIYPTLTEIDAALTDIQSAGGNSSAEGLRSFIGRLNYTGYNKYLFEANLRVDGSSKFLPGSQYGYFPSVAVGWRFTEEDFIRNFTQGFMTSGKLRASYGSLGNNSGVGRYEQQETLAQNNYIISNSIIRGFVNMKMINRFLTWETTSVFNVGLDLSFFNNRLTTSLDWYDRLTEGMNRPTDLSIFLSGAYNPPPRTNIGNLRNRGIEGDFAWRDRVRDVQYGVALNVSHNTTTLEKWNEFLNKGTIFIDMPYHFVYTYESIGIAQTWQDIYNATPQGAQPGDILHRDLNGDGRITGDDRKALPRFQTDRPTTFFALNTNASWKGFDIAMLFQGSSGRKDFWTNNYNNTNFGASRYASTWSHWTNPWNHENRDGEWPRLGGSGNNRDDGTFWLEDMSFVRFKNLQIGYTVPQKIANRFKMANLRIAGSAENLATFTKYRGLDPEKAGNAQNLYPINKTYSISINLSF